jgi:hypothetical protein
MARLPSPPSPMHLQMSPRMINAELAQLLPEDILILSAEMAIDHKRPPLGLEDKARLLYAARYRLGMDAAAGGRTPNAVPDPSTLQQSQPPGQPQFVRQHPQHIEQQHPPGQQAPPSIQPPSQRIKRKHTPSEDVRDDGINPCAPLLTHRQPKNGLHAESPPSKRPKRALIAQSSGVDLFEFELELANCLLMPEDPMAPKLSLENQQAQIPQQQQPGQPQQGVPGGHPKHLQNDLDLNGMRPQPSQQQRPGVSPNMAPNPTPPPGMLPILSPIMLPGTDTPYYMPPVSHLLLYERPRHALTCRPRRRLFRR